MSPIPIALQLYTVRDACEKDFVGTLRQVADIGYAGVELAGTYGLSAEEIKQVLDDLNLRCVGSHTGDRPLEEVVALHKTLDCKYVGWPSFPGGLPQDEASLEAALEKLKNAAANYAQQGLVLYYHNHNREFEPIGGKAILDWFLESTDPDQVKAEVDVFWVQFAGVDPAAYIRKYPGRCPLVHLKDMTEDRDFAEVGEGTLDFEAIFAACEEVGTEWYIVEQDRCYRPSVESARISFENLKRWGMA